jgi:ligand-binding sensor domain-containing protein
MKWPLNQIKSLPTPAMAAAFLKRRRRSLIALAALIATVALIAGWTVKRRADREFEAARVLSVARAFAPFEKEARRAFAGNEVKLIQSSRAARGLAQFNGSVFAATGGGLVEFDEDGKTKRRYTTLDGLPESDLTSIAVFNSKLFIGSRSQGLIVFDGKRFERYRWTDRDAQAVTVLLEDRGRLLIGTFAGGLLEFDGGRFREIKISIASGSERGPINGPTDQFTLATARGTEPRRTESEQEGQRRLAGITRLKADGARLFVGTFADGLWVNNSDRWSHFTVADGLPSNRVVGVVADGDRLIVASDFGVAVSDAGSSQRRFQTIATMPELSSAVRWGGDILLCKDDGEILRLSLESVRRAVTGMAESGSSLMRSRSLPLTAPVYPVDWRRPESLSSCQLASFVIGNKPMGETLMLMSGEGMWRLGWQDERLSGPPRVSRFGESPNLGPGALKSNVISALAFDDLGRLWAGNFRDGIDVIAPDGLSDGRRVTHLESEAVREINALVWDGKSRRMLAATAQGLIRFDGSFGSDRLSKVDGLLSNSVLGAAVIQGGDRDGLALATSRGLSFGDAKRFRGLTTVQGLPDNGVYSVLSHREFIYAATRGGLAQIAGGRVVRVFKDSNSKLSHNWATALCAVGPRLFIGAYGGGVFELTAAGELVSFASEAGRQTVNQNAMASDGQRLYVGALDGAWVLDLRSQQWMRLKDELPSSVVLSVAVGDDHVYFGSTGGIARIEKAYLEKRFGKMKT